MSRNLQWPLSAESLPLRDVLTKLASTQVPDATLHIHRKRSRGEESLFAESPPFAVDTSKQFATVFTGNPTSAASPHVTTQSRDLSFGFPPSNLDTLSYQPPQGIAWGEGSTPAPLAMFQGPDLQHHFLSYGPPLFSPEGERVGAPSSEAALLCQTVQEDMMAEFVDFGAPATLESTWQQSQQPALTR